MNVLICEGNEIATQFDNRLSILKELRFKVSMAITTQVFTFYYLYSV